MSPREEVEKILYSLDKISLNVEDGERWAILEGVVPGKIRALRAYLKQLNMTSLVEEIDEMNLREFNLIELLTRLKSYVIPEARRQILQGDGKESNACHESFWADIHPKTRSVSQSLFQGEHYAEAAEAAFKEINANVKQIVKQRTGTEFDGPDLMNRAFSPKQPIIAIADLSSATGQNIQKGYMQIFAGAMTGIRNPKAHHNIRIDANRAIHFL